MHDTDATRARRSEVVRELSELRRLLWYETPARLHRRSPSGRSSKGAAADETGGRASSARAVQRATGDPGWTGLPFSAEFERYLSHPEQWNRTGRIGMLSLLEVREWCAARHVTHDVGGRPLCYLLLAKAAYWGADPPRQLDGVILPALRHAKHYRDRSGRARLTRLDEPLPYEPLARSPRRTGGRAVSMGRDGRGRHIGQAQTGRSGPRPTVTAGRPESER